MTAREVGRLAATALVAILSCACSETHGSASHAGGDTRAFVPEDLPNTELDGEGGLRLSAFTLVQAENGVEMYAAVRNEGAAPLCEAGMTVDFVDESERLLGSTGVSLYSGSFYRIDDGSGVVVSCIAPGGVAMGGSVGILELVTLEQIARVRHAFPSFVVNEIVPVQGLSVSEVRAAARAGGSAYAGVLVNGLDAEATNPRVSVFPVNRAGRPLGMATSDLAVALAPGASTAFETTVVRERGEGQVAFAAVMR